MRSLTLLSLLIASSFASPVFHSENALSRRAATRKEDVIKADVEVANDVKVVGREHKDVALRHNYHNRGLIDQLLEFIAGLFYDLDLDIGYVDSNEDLIEELFDLGYINDKDASILGEIDLLGELDSKYGILGNLIDIGIVGFSDDRYLDQQEDWQDENQDILDIGAILFQDDYYGEWEQQDMNFQDEDGEIDVDFNADVDVDVDVDADVDA